MKFQGSGLLGAFALGVAAMAMPSVAMAQDCSPVTIDLGEGKSIEGGCKPLRIAYLAAASNNTYLQSMVKAANDAAAEIGATIDIFDPNWSPTVQFNQAQNIISSGNYDAIVAVMNDGVQACKILTEDAPAAGILVAVANLPLCGKATEEGDALWAPGTLNFTGGSQGREAFREWIFQIAAENPGKQKVAVLTGPDLNANTINTEKAMEEVMAANPEWELVGIIKTDYSVLQGNEKTLPLFQANPDLTLLISNYSDITRGAVTAARQSGALDRGLKIYDNGGNEWAFQAVREGLLTSTRTLTPYTELYDAVMSVAAAWKGETVPRFQPLHSDFVTKENVDSIQPQY